jgi:LemA protein
MMGLWIFLGIVALLFFYFIGVYNRLVQLKNRFVNAFAQIDVQLQRRYDLIPNLVETAKAYMAHEKDTLQAVIEARNQAVSANQQAAAAPDDPQAIDRLSKADASLGSALGRLFALSENYPDLKANQTMQSLMEELTHTENLVAFARQAFNDAVMAYNTYREQFPNSLIAGGFGFGPAHMLELQNEEARQAPKVQF